MSDSTTENKTDRHSERTFWIAVMLLAGFLILIGFPVVRDDIGNAKELAGIFSGWIAAIIGFYFMRNQALQTAKVAEGSGLKKGTDMASDLERTLDKITKEHNETLADLELVKNSYKQLWKKYKGIKG